MSLQAGSVTVASDASYSGTGLAKALMDGYAVVWNVQRARPPIVGADGPVTSQMSDGPYVEAIKLATFKEWAALANALAGQIVAYITTHAVVHVGGDEGTIE